MQIVKRVKNGVLYDNGAIRIDNVRGSYVHADKPYKGKADAADKVPKYSMVSLLPKATHGEVKALLDEAVESILKEKNKGVGIKSDAKFIRNGDDAARTEYVGMWTVNASETKAPSCRDQKGELIIVRDADGEIVRQNGVAVRDIEAIRNLFCSGYWFNVLVRPWWQDNDFGKKVNAGLVGIQFVKKDETFGDAVIDDSDAWDSVEGDDGMGEANDGL